MTSVPHPWGTARAAAVTLLLLGVGPTAGLAQWRPPDPDCRKWAQAASADPGLWTKLAECGAVGGQALAAVLRGEAARADTIRLGALERVLLQIQDSAVFRTALDVARDSTAAPAAQIVALLVALGQFEPAIVRRRSSGFTMILADSVDSRCHVDLDRKRPAFRSLTRIPAVAPWLTATAADQVAGGNAPAPVRLFARCVRLAIDDGLVAPPTALAGTVRDTAGRPIGNADVVAIAGKALARTNADGTFLLGDLAPGPELLLIRAIGFAPERFPATLVARDTVPVDIVLGPAPQQLEELTVTARGRVYSGKLAAFGQRMRSSQARRSAFIGPEEIETWGQFDLTNLFRRAGLQVGPGGLMCPGADRNASFGRVPLIAVYLDGSLFFKDEVFDVNSVPVQWIAAIEVYRRIVEAPIEFQSLSAGCAVLITTKG